MIEIEDAALDRLLADDPGGPVVMLNLLRFRPDGGRESYLRYGAYLQQSGVGPRYGTEIVYQGGGDHAIVAEDGQAWDMVLLVRYPSRHHFVNMIRDPDYRAGEHLRTEALVESVLQPTAPAS